MNKLKRFKRFYQSFFSPIPRIQTWFILFDGEFVGSYFGPDLEGLLIQVWMEDFPGDPNPITLTEIFPCY